MKLIALIILTGTWSAAGCRQVSSGDEQATEAWGDRPTADGDTDLDYLNLNYNIGISDISPLTGLANLTGLYLSGNSIIDISALVSNYGVDSGDYVNIEGNPLDCGDAATQGYIASLEERGVDLRHDCQ